MKRELRKLLKEAGYNFLRHGKHELWKKGDQIIPIPTGAKMDPRFLKRLKCEIKRNELKGQG